VGQTAYRANLSSATFPMTIAESGRTVIIPGPDQNFDRRVDPEGEQKDAGIPQALYMENVLPTPNGYQSVGYKTLAALPPAGYVGPGTPTVRGELYLYVESGAVAGIFRRFLVLFRSGASFSDVDAIATSFTSATFAWTQCTGTIPRSLNEFLSCAKVIDKTYVFDGTKLYEVTNPSADILNFTDVSASVTGITLTDVICIWATANYLLVARKDGKILWSSLTTPTDFVSSLVSGAGSIDPNDLKTNVKFVKEAVNGFYIYTESGVVFGQYTGNARYPFKFSAVLNSGAYTSSYQVFGDSRSNTQVAIDNTGNVRFISGNIAQLEAPELSNFLERTKQADEFNLSTFIFSLASVASSLRLTYVLDKYICIKFTVGTSTYFCVYDTALRRYGKLKVAGNLYTDLKNFYVFGTEEGDAGYQAGLDIYNTDFPANGAILLGKFQYVRSRVMQMEEIEIEGPQNTAVVPSPAFSVVLMPSTDGRNFDAPVPLTARSISGGLATYDCHRTAKNHSILIKGAFSINTLQLRFVPGGER
jgi:hypothetical protein